MTFTHLKLGHFYQVTCRALGEDPNGPTTNFSGVLNDANLYLSAAELRVPAPVGGTYQQNLTPTQFPVLYPFTAGGTADTTTVTALPAKLKDRTYNGHADDVTVKVQDGVIKQAEGPAKIIGPLSLAADSGTAAIERMGFWNYTALQPSWQQNENEGLDGHLMLKLRGLVAGTTINKLTLVVTGATELNTVGYVSDDAPDNAQNRQFLGVYHNNVMKFRGADPSLTVPANGSLDLDLYLDAYPLSRLGAGTLVNLTVETSSGTLTFPNVTL